MASGGSTWSDRLGRYGVWRPAQLLTPKLASEVEALGYGTLWVGGSPPADLQVVEDLLAATSHLVIATGVVNMWMAPADEVARSYHRIEAAYPGRFLLGVGVGHREVTKEYQSPYAKMVDYLDRLDAAGVPADRRVLAALGPKALRLAASRTAGAHPYFVPAEHTRRAREILGAGPLLAPEHKVLLEIDPDRARAVAREAAARYLRLRNYSTNLQRLGYGDADVTGGGSDRLIDALVGHGDVAAVTRAVEAHLEAGADHVCIQVLPVADDPVPTLRAIAGQLGLS